jgi:predicted nucleotidyltransferase
MSACGPPRHPPLGARAQAHQAQCSGLLDDACRLWHHDSAMATRTQTLAAPLTERERVLRVLRGHEAEIRAQGVTRLRLFGSVARGEAGPKSDVDLMVDIDRRTRFSLLDLVGLQHFLQGLLGREVDLGTTVDKMRPRMRRQFEADAIEVF